MTCMGTWMSSKFGRVRPQTMELADLERIKKIPYTYNGENDDITFSRLFYWILFICARNEDMRKSLNEFEIRPDTTTGFHGNRYSYSGKNGVIVFSSTFLIGFISYLQVTMIYIRA